MIAERIERISVDSTWARRSSGHRGTLLKWIEMVSHLDPLRGECLNQDDLALFASLIETGYGFLREAAREKFGGSKRQT